MLCRYRPGERWDPTLLAGGRAVLAVLPHVVAARHRPADALRWLAAALARATVVEGARGEAGETARAILAALTKGSRPRPARSCFN